ncbi:hypothetical protein V6N13_062349 [Hibiscus sabdariffa]|uniref:Uncharacterized protein n=2 Tax=Hibiscus sabdariffa TaxID=183260 RepID=A0ABR2BQG4_9ROSI
MDLSRRIGAKSSVVAGSVWETRMRSDEIKGGFKVFSVEDDSSGEENSGEGLSLKKGQTFGKRKTWKSESFDGFEKTPIRVTKGKDLSLSVDGGIKKIPPVQVKEGVRDLSKSVDGSSPEEHCKESNVNMAKSSPEISVDDDEFYVEDEEMEVGDEKKSFDIKEMNVPLVENPNKDANEMKKFPEEKKPNKALNAVAMLQEDNPSKVANEVKKISQFHNKAAPFSTVNKQPPPVVKCTTSVYTTSAKPTESTPSQCVCFHLMLY